MTLEIPELVMLEDGTAAVVKAVSAVVADGHIDRVVYTVEKDSGAWVDVAGTRVRPHAESQRPASWSAHETP